MSKIGKFSRSKGDGLQVKLRLTTQREVRGGGATGAFTRCLGCLNRHTLFPTRSFDDTDRGVFDDRTLGGFRSGLQISGDCGFCASNRLFRSKAGGVCFGSGTHVEVRGPSVGACSCVRKIPEHNGRSPRNYVEI